jgi:amino acid transporter
VFVYLREAYGPAIAFLFGWTLLILVPAATGGVALVFAEYLGRLIPLGPTGTRAAATAAVILVTVSGYRSVRGASAILGVATWGKVAAIAGLVAVSFLLGDGHAGSFGSGAPAMRGMHWSGLALGLVSALWAYNGFQEMVSVAGEVRDPHRIVPLALLAGTITVVIVYLAANAAYLYVLPFAVLQASPLVASDTAVRVLGAAGERAVAAMVMVSTFGTVTGLTLSNPRVFYAMARERLLFEPLGRVHPRFATPHVAVATFGALTCLFVWTGTFEQLASAYILGVWPFLSLAAAGVLVLRRTRPDLPRPYRTPGYPIVPLVFILGTVWVVGSALVADPWKVLQGLGLTALGVPVYLFWRRR